MKKKITRPDGTVEELEGTAEELAELERKGGAAPVKEEKKGKKQLLKEEYLKASKEEREEVRQLVMQEFAESIKDLIKKDKKPHEGCGGIVERGIDHDVYRSIKDDLNEIKVRLPIGPQMVPYPVPVMQPYKPREWPNVPNRWWETQITWSSAGTRTGPDGVSPLLPDPSVAPLTVGVTNGTCSKVELQGQPLDEHAVVSIPTVFHVGN